MILSDKAKLLGALSGILIAGFLITSGGGYVASRNAIHQGVSVQTLSLTGDNIYSEIQKDLLQPVLIASMMANDALLRDWILKGESDVAPMARYLSEIRTRYETVTAFLVSEKTRNYYHATGLNRRVSEADPREKWYFRAKALPAPYEINVDFDQANKDTMAIFINHLVFDYNGNFIGITGVGLTFDTVSRLIESYQQRFRRRIYFVDPRGTIVLTGKSMSDLREKSIGDAPGLREISRQLLHGTAVPADLEYVSESGPVLVNSRFIKELGWYLVVEQNEIEDMRPVQRMFVLNLVISGAVTFVVLFIILLTVNRHRRLIEKFAAENLKLVMAKQDFLAMFSHEMKNALSSLNAVVHNLLRTAGNAPAGIAKKYRKLDRVANNIGLLMDNFLADSRLEAADFRPVPASLNLTALVKQVIDGYGESRYRVLFSAGPEPVVVQGDGTLLQLAVSNILQNAIKYSPDADQIAISLEVREEHAHIAVTDQGAGIASEELGRIFEPFYRSQRSLATDGSGLGLSIVKKIMERHGGSIRVQSREGEGSTFTLILPCVPQEGSLNAH